MKKTILLAAIIAGLTASSTAITATYAGTVEKEGPQTEFVIGYASDQASTVELQIPEREGLNITYPEVTEFDPGNTSKSVLRDGQNIPLIELKIRVESGEIVQREYEIPVTLQAYRKNISEESSTRPQIVQERQFSFTYLTAESPDFGFEGDLIDSNETVEEKDEPDEVLNLSEENTITEEKENITQEGGEKESGSRTTLMLAVAVVLVFGYTIYEAFT
jgi:hypothetical protein